MPQWGVELEDSGHFFNMFKYHCWITLYETITDYLKDDCNPDSLYTDA